MFGSWLIIADISIFSALWVRLNNLIVGVLITIIGAAMLNRKLLVGGLTIIIGYWLVLSIFISSIEDGKICLWSNLIVGALLFFGGLIIHAPKPPKSKDFYTHLKSRDNRVL